MESFKKHIRKSKTEFDPEHKITGDHWWKAPTPPNKELAHKLATTIQKDRKKDNARLKKERICQWEDRQRSSRDYKRAQYQFLRNKKADPTRVMLNEKITRTNSK